MKGEKKEDVEKENETESLCVPVYVVSWQGVSFC